MKVSGMKIELKVNPNNPQIFDDLSKLENSIKEFPKMMELRKLVYDPETMFVLGGNKRLICLQNLGFEEIPSSWVISAKGLTDEEKKRFIIADNVTFGEWDLEMLEEWDMEDLTDWGVDVPALINIETLDKRKKITDEEFKEEIDRITDVDAELPIVPDFMENYNAFIIITKNDIDEAFIREYYGLNKTIGNKNGLSKRKPNIITVDEIRERCQI